MTIDSVLTRIDQQLEASLSRLIDLIAIPSISADPAYRNDCHRAASWLVDDLVGMGFTASLRETSGHPMVVAHHPGEAGRQPRLLFYGHYDVQPVDPLEQWRWDPFAARVMEFDGHRVITGRGASDDKGQLMTFLEACRAYLAVTGSLPCPVTIFLEGEEESGSPSLDAFLNRHAEELAADVALVCDTGMWNRGTPAVTTSLRGLVAETVTVSGPGRDLHSGLYGGAAANPLHVLCRILDGLHDADGRVTLPGFYDGVEELPPEIRASWQGLARQNPTLLAEVGLQLPAGEPDRIPLELVWSRPTAEVNGLCGGYCGQGFKTVIPSQATARVSFRLVGRQDPEQVRERFRRQARSALPADCDIAFEAHGGAPAIQFAYDSPLISLAAKALSTEWAASTALIGMGGSIPVVAQFLHRLKMPSLLVGFSLPDDNLHSPNEKYDLRSFHLGQRSWVRILAALATGGPTQ